MEYNKNVGQVSTILTALTTKEADLLSQFDKIEEPEAQIDVASLKHLLVNKQDVAANKGKIKGRLPVKHSFVFCETL